MRDVIKHTVSDALANFFYYDRKEDESFTPEDVENLTNSDIKEIADMFKNEILKQQK